MHQLTVLAWATPVYGSRWGASQGGFQVALASQERGSGIKGHRDSCWRLRVLAWSRAEPAL